MSLRTPAFNDAKTYGFEWLRYLAEVANLQEGVIGAGDFKVTAAAGGGMKVDVAAGASFTKGDSGTPGVGLSQGLFLTVNDASIANAVTLSASDGTNPRIDQICLKVRDSTDLATGADDATLVVVTGTATGGATLDNRTGSAALPADHLRLADVLVPAGSTATSAGNIRDRRPWARGALSAISRQAGSYTVTGGATTAIDTTNLQARLELSGVPVHAHIEGNGTNTAIGSSTDGVAFQLNVDGAQSGIYGQFQPPYAGGGVALVAAGVYLPAAPNNGAGQSSSASGSHLFTPMLVNAGGGGTSGVAGSAQVAIQFLLRELVAANTNNGTA